VKDKGKIVWSGTTHDIFDIEKIREEQKKMPKNLRVFVKEAADWLDKRLARGEC